MLLGDLLLFSVLVIEVIDPIEEGRLWLLLIRTI